jgi:hypothetical protein
VTAESLDSGWTCGWKRRSGYDVVGTSQGGFIGLCGGWQLLTAIHAKQQLQDSNPTEEQVMPGKKHV